MNFVTSISLVVLGAMFLALLGWGSIRAAWRNCEGRRGVFAALAILAAVCSIVAQKPSPDTPTITVDALLRDVGCYATNNVFHAAVTNAQNYAGVDFSDCDLMVYARERASTNAASWFELTPRKKFSQQPADYAIENATNFDYMVYLNYVPPSPVHTNGVFELYGFVIENEAQGEPDQLAAGFINSRANFPWSNPYITDGLVGMWDGEWNVSGGSHDPATTKWKDLSGQAFDFDVPSTLSWSDDALVFPPNGDKNTNRLYTNHSFTQNKTIEVVAKFTTNSSSILRANTSGHTLVFHWGFSLFWNGTNRGSGNLSAGQRHYAALCIDDANGYRIYRDTANVYRNSSVVLSPLNETVFTVGYYPNTIYAFYGDVCAIRFYNRPLTPEEIAHNYKIDKERFNLP